jgi:hypothetical protein
MQIADTYMYLAPHDNYISPLLSRDSLAVCHPGQVRRRRTRAGIQKESDYIELSLDSPSASLRVVSPSTLLRTVSLSNHGSRPL